MQIKKYEVQDMKEAIKRIKNDLGPDAVILSTRNVKKGGGAFGMFSREVVEVVAARDYTNKPQDGQSYHESFQGHAADNAVTDNGLRDEVQKIRVEMSLTPAELRGMKSEIAVLKEYIQELIRGDEDEEIKTFSDKIVLFQRRLISGGIDPSLARRLIKIIDNKIQGDQKDNMDQINRYGLEMLQKQVKTTGPVYKTNSGQKIAVFIGPTGVGKTTTIAKIAAKYTLVDKKKVNLLTFDTFRIGAIEQLKIYAKIIGLPVDIVLSPSDLPDIINKRRDADLILIDTAGRNHKDRVFIGELRELLNHTRSLDCHLVLSATSSDIILTDIINQFSDMPISGLLFTKLDEAAKFGLIFNAMIKAQKPLSYFATGQRVPEDIEMSTPERLCKLILGMDTINCH